MGTHKAAVSGGVLAVAGILAVQGCMSGVVSVGNKPGAAGEASDEGGSDSGSGTGGTLGGSSGAGGKAGNGAGGTSSGAGKGAGGTSTSGAGKGGTAARGGRGGSAGRGGTTGSGGDSGAPFTFDADCDCTLGPEGEFDCTLDLAAAQAQITVPQDCTSGSVLDLDYVHQKRCSGGDTHYEWSVGTENVYDVTMSGGSIAHFSASGYVGGLCGIDTSVYGFGTVEAGTPPQETCFDECSVCDNATEGTPTSLPVCDPCTPDPDNSSAVKESLDDFCKLHACPADIAAARALLASACPYATMWTGCPFTVVQQETTSGGDFYHFDAQTGELVGIVLSGDTPWGQCGVNVYQGGDIPAVLCNAQPCSICPSTSGSAGAGGGGAGTGSTSLPYCGD